MKFVLVAFLASVAYAAANPAFRDIACPDVGLMCLDKNTYTYCINLGIMKIVGSTAYSCPAGFVCDHSTTTPCIPEKKATSGKAAQKSIKKERASALNENLDDLVAQLAETTPQDIIEATTYAPTTLGEPYGKNGKAAKPKGGKKH